MLEEKKYLFYVKISVCDAKVLYDFQLNINSERNLKQKFLKYFPWLENLSLDWENRTDWERMHFKNQLSAKLTSVSDCQCLNLDVRNYKNWFSEELVFCLIVLKQFNEIEHFMPKCII